MQDISLRALSAQSNLESVCESDKWDNSALGDLSLTGLQPCFEDVVLLLPVYLGAMALCGVRIGKCWNKVSDDTEARKTGAENRRRPRHRGRSTHPFSFSCAWSGRAQGNIEGRQVTVQVPYRLPSILCVFGD